MIIGIVIGFFAAAAFGAWRPTAFRAFVAWAAAAFKRIDWHAIGAKIASLFHRNKPDDTDGAGA